MAKTRAQENRAIRQEALREELSNKGLLVHVLDIAKELQEPDSVLESTDIQRLKAAADINLKLINKYLPDIKAVEHSGQIDSEVTRKHRVSFRRD